MKKLGIILGCALIIGLVVMGLVTKKQSPTVNAENPYKFYYYPKLNTYYDFQRGDFVYTLDGGQTWLKKKPATSQLPEKLSSKVMITGPLPEVWLYNKEHREKYKGINTNYLSRGYQDGEAEASAITTGPHQADGSNQSTTQENKGEGKVPEEAGSKQDDGVVLTPEEEWEQEMDKTANQLIKRATKHLTKDVIEVETWDSTEAE